MAQCVLVQKKTVLALRSVYFRNVIFFLNCVPFFQNFVFLINGLYLSKKAKNLKNKKTFFSSTFKVWENKVSLFFVFLAHFLRYGHFIDFWAHSSQEAYIRGDLRFLNKFKFICKDISYFYLYTTPYYVKGPNFHFLSILKICNFVQPSYIST